MSASQITATVFGLGYLRPASGTWASLAAIALASGLHLWGGFPLVAAATVLVTALGFWACAAFIPGLGSDDPSEVVIDEVAGQFLAFSATSFGLWHAGVGTLPWPAWLAPLVLFRLFDIWKPWLVGWADRKHGPHWVMIDDLFAGLFAALVSVALAGVYHGVLGR
ncbi:phosphatidylglycerophosphatase A [Paenirhodobacter sp.]|uniref:phosphatidylglycerophosphatase A family protein n=1 Tax=Paenirhodobacter sp. TaxID=1965326 RepID=UPI003B4253E7